MSRIITIIDALPINVTSLGITSSSGDNFANTGKIITLRLETDSDDLGTTLLELYLDENLQIQQMVALLHLPLLSYLMIQTETLHFQLKRQTLVMVVSLSQRMRLQMAHLSQ